MSLGNPGVPGVHMCVYLDWAAAAPVCVPSTRQPVDTWRPFSTTKQQSTLNAQAPNAWIIIISPFISTAVPISCPRSHGGSTRCTENMGRDRMMFGIYWQFQHN